MVSRHLKYIYDCNKSTIADSYNSKIDNEEDRSTETNNLQNVQDELRNVIELMGPNTPQLTIKSSSDTDNEESSYIASTSIYSSVLQVNNILFNLKYI